MEVCKSLAPSLSQIFSRGEKIIITGNGRFYHVFSCRDFGVALLRFLLLFMRSRRSSRETPFANVIGPRWGPWWHFSKSVKREGSERWVRVRILGMQKENMTNPFEISDIRELILKHRKEAMLRDVWRKRYSSVVDDLSCHCYTASYIASRPPEEAEDLLACCEQGFVYDHDIEVLCILIWHGAL